MNLNFLRSVREFKELCVRYNEVHKILELMIIAYIAT